MKMLRLFVSAEQETRSALDTFREENKDETRPKAVVETSFSVHRRSHLTAILKRFAAPDEAGFSSEIYSRAQTGLSEIVAELPILEPETAGSDTSSRGLWLKTALAACFGALTFGFLLSPHWYVTDTAPAETQALSSLMQLFMPPLGALFGVFIAENDLPFVKRLKNMANTHIGRSVLFLERRALIVGGAILLAFTLFAVMLLLFGRSEAPLLAGILSLGALLAVRFGMKGRTSIQSAGADVARLAKTMERDREVFCGFLAALSNTNSNEDSQKRSDNDSERLLKRVTTALAQTKEQTGDAERLIKKLRKELGIEEGASDPIGVGEDAVFVWNAAHEAYYQCLGIVKDGDTVEVIDEPVIRNRGSSNEAVAKKGVVQPLSD
ncbi:MAG: hypothetical protein AAGE89_10305 [Pseudomonadota bacterium]